MLRLFFKEEKSEQSKDSVVLGRFNQIKDFEKHIEPVSSGHCLAITRFWLLLHSQYHSKNIQELAQTESTKFDFIKNHAANVTLLQKWYKAYDSFDQSNVTFAAIGLTVFTDASFKSIAINETNCDASQKLPIRAAELTNAIKLILENGADERSAIEFGFYWTDNTPITEKTKTYSDGRALHGHSVGIIKNPCPGYEILFFDCNHHSIAFKKTSDFLSYAQSLFEMVLSSNGKKGTPVLWDASYATDIQPEIKVVIDKFENTTPATSQASLKPPEHHIIDIDQPPKRPR